MTIAAPEYTPDHPRPWSVAHTSLYDHRSAPHEQSGTARAVHAYAATRPRGLGMASAIRTVADLLGAPASRVERAQRDAREVAARVARTGSGAIHHTTPVEWNDYA